jgi:putative inorganic carbon (HCO3(-)) transporter
MLAFLAVLVLSSHRAQSTQLAVDYIRRYVLEGVLIYWLVINVVRTLPTLKRVVWTLLAAGALLSALSLYQEVTNSYDQEFGGLAYRNYVEPEDREPRAAVKRRTSDRAQGPVNEPNRFAQMLVVLLPLAVFAARATPRRAAKLLAAGAGALIGAGVLLTLSRGAMVSIVLVAITATCIRWIRPRFVLACVGGLLVLGPFLTPFFTTRLQSITAATTLVSYDPSAVSEADGSTRMRATAMLAALNVFRDHPVLGVGPGQYSPFYSLRYHSALGNKFSDMQTTLRAHIMYFEVAAEEGLVGLVIFLAIVGVIVRDLWRGRQRMRSRDPQLMHLATACFLAIACYLTTAVFLHLNYQRYYWFLLALSGAAVHIIRTSELERAHA